MLERARAAEGFTKESELELLHELASTMLPGCVVVEVGSWKGRSTLAICEGLDGLAGATLVAVDTFDGDAEVHQYAPRQTAGSVRAEFERNTAGYGFLRVLQADSHVAAREFDDASVDWVFIDAAHDYRSVVGDIRAWARTIKPGGLISGHDYGRSGVTDAVRRFFGDITVQHSIWMTRERPRLRLLVLARIALRRLL